MGVFCSGKYSGVFGSIREFWGVFENFDFVGCVGVGGGYGAPRPGCAFHGEKIPRYGNVFPPNLPFRPPARKIPPRPAVLFIPPSPPGLTSTRVKQKPRKNIPGLGFGLKGYKSSVASALTCSNRCCNFSRMEACCSGLALCQNVRTITSGVAPRTGSKSLTR